MLLLDDKQIEDIFVRFEKIHERDIQTHTETDGHRSMAPLRRLRDSGAGYEYPEYPGILT